MLQSFMLRVLCLLSVSLLAICMAGSGAAPLNVTGTLGQSASLFPGIPGGMDVAELVWKKTKALVLYVKGNITNLGSEDFKSRLTLDPVSFSLQIRDLRREDAGDYEAFATAVSGAENRVTVRLEVYEYLGILLHLPCQGYFITKDSRKFVQMYCGEHSNWFHTVWYGGSLHRTGESCRKL